jgi:hypothetical protein
MDMKNKMRGGVMKCFGRQDRPQCYRVRPSLVRAPWVLNGDKLRRRSCFPYGSQLIFENVLLSV